ncbi:hypothetical protein HMPREF0476_0412 [Kingella kingae ATCC 23330]|uniref:Uncharacterized protein n=1 Tax=Kingella kingae ATCC 23330 TaxID=887327 RepID=F5S5C9_KINKI|nr:hypothetical protein HMPREF0476_0412 [Kingella kingae ATCC 23330]
MVSGCVCHNASLSKSNNKWRLLCRFDSIWQLAKAFNRAFNALGQKSSLHRT